MKPKSMEDHLLPLSLSRFRTHTRTRYDNNNNNNGDDDSFHDEHLEIIRFFLMEREK